MLPIKSTRLALLYCMLLLAGTGSSRADRQLNYEFMTAAGNGDQAAVQRLLEKGADINAVNLLGLTALVNAILRGDVEMVRLLLGKGARVNATYHNLYDATPLILTITSPNKSSELARLLLEKGADPNLRQGKAPTALMYAVKMHELKTMELLIAKGADTKVRDQLGRPLVNVVVHEARKSRNFDALKMLIAKGVDVNAESADGITPITSVFGDPELTDLLVKAGAKYPMASK